jgi:3,4-dihydroxy 2-butanone 4-phosphate synthase/GTP cyclohydrolase II
MDTGLDTVEANLELGFAADQRSYEAAVAILQDLQVHRIRLLTNNPQKLAEFADSRIRVVARLPLNVQPNGENLHYMRTKRDRLGHLLDLQAWTP